MKVIEEYFPPGGGGTSLSGLNEDVRPDRVWFSGAFVLNGVSMSSLFVLNGVWVYRITTNSSITPQRCK